MKAGTYGTIAGVLFGLSASLTKPVIETLHVSVSDVLSDWMLYALAIAGGIGFVVQQLSLATGKLAPSVATTSVANPVVSVLLGVILLEERLSRPAWHVVVAVIGLGAALAGAVAITVKREGGEAPARNSVRAAVRLRRCRPCPSTPERRSPRASASTQRGHDRERNTVRHASRASRGYRRSAAGGSARRKSRRSRRRVRRQPFLNSRPPRPRSRSEQLEDNAGHHVAVRRECGRAGVCDRQHQLQHSVDRCAYWRPLSQSRAEGRAPSRAARASGRSAHTGSRASGRTVDASSVTSVPRPAHDPASSAA